jgi:hypothetical protein
MFRALFALLITTFVLSAAVIDEPVRPTPLVRTLAPSPAKPGAVLVAAGQNLGREFVASAYLTQGENTYQLEITNQMPESLKVRIPADLKPGRFGLMVLTRGETPRYIDEPVFVNIE